MRTDFAVFIDRDGTINVDVDFLSSPAQLQLIPRSADAIRELHELNIPVVVITNQSGIARGLYSEDDLHAVHRSLEAILRQQGGAILCFYYCPHHPSVGLAEYVQDCNCRKPKPGMLHAAAMQYGFNLRHSFVVGDKCADVQAGRAVGAMAIQVATGYGEQEKNLCTNERDYFASDLYDAVQFIKQELVRRNIQQ